MDRVLSSLSLLLVATLLVGLVGPRPTAAQHPTAVTSIVNSNQDTTMEANHNGSLLMPGTYSPTSPSDSIPATGAGTRLMWYPAKAALRAGRVGKNKDGTQWDADSTGNYSVAFGLDTKANAENAVAMGWKTTASGARAVAMGTSTIASGFAALAMGENSKATASTAVAVGAATKASNASTTALGNNTTASGLVATAMGQQTTASGQYATAMGRRTTAATNRSLSIGKCNSANQPSADGTLFVVGNGSLSSGTCLHSDALVLDKNGNLTISGSLTQNSDRRLKTSVEPLGDGVLEKLAHLRPARFEFKNQRTHPSGDQIGLIAQDVRKEFPALVSEGSSGYLSLAYPKLTTVLLKGLQEQQRQIERQRATIDSLDRRVRRVEEQREQLAELKAENQQIKERQRTLKRRLSALEAERSGSILAGLVGPGGVALLLALLGGLSLGVLWERRS